MEINVQYWHWLVFGMVLIIAEIFVPSFTIFWFGLGGIVVAAISDDIADWGITMKTVEIQDINPSQTMQAAMEEQAAAVLEAEGRLEASQRDAKAKVVLAEASQLAIQKVTQAIGENEIPVMYRIGEKYVDALKNLSTSQNAKVILMPAEIPSSIRGIIATGK